MDQINTINGKRIMDRIEVLAQIGKTTENGVHRMALTPEDKQAQDLVTKWMIEAGLTVRRDQFGNLIGRKEGKIPRAPVVMIGSHIDSVPNGGRFDGTIGVLGGIEVAQSIQSSNIELSHPLEIVAFCDEEGGRFESGLFGSRGIVGKLSNEELSKIDEDGTSRYEALQSFGLNPKQLANSVRGEGEVKVYLEMHIEQGPYLESVNHPVGIVTGIAGPVWFNVKIMGEAGHAGTVPMQLRRDPMMGSAEIIQNIGKLCSVDPTAATVGTVGKIKAFPGGGNVIPSYVEFTVDIRDIELKRRDEVVQLVKREINTICKNKGLKYEIEENLNFPPTLCAPHVVKAMERASKNLQLETSLMVSGAGHDAMALAHITDIGLIFVRCREGISHNPKESAEEEDIIKGVELLLGTTLQYI